MLRHILARAGTARITLKNLTGCPSHESVSRLQAAAVISLIMKVRPIDEDAAKVSDAVSAVNWFGEHNSQILLALAPSKVTPKRPRALQASITPGILNHFTASEWSGPFKQSPAHATDLCITRMIQLRIRSISEPCTKYLACFLLALFHEPNALSLQAKEAKVASFKRLFTKKCRNLKFPNMRELSLDPKDLLLDPSTAPLHQALYQGEQPVYCDKNMLLKIDLIDATFNCRGGSRAESQHELALQHPTEQQNTQMMQNAMMAMMMKNMNMLQQQDQGCRLTFNPNHRETNPNVRRAFTLEDVLKDGDIIGGRTVRSKSLQDGAPIEQGSVQAGAPIEQGIVVHEPAGSNVSIKPSQQQVALECAVVAQTGTTEPNGDDSKNGETLQGDPKAWAMRTLDMLDQRDELKKQDKKDAQKLERERLAQEKKAAAQETHKQPPPAEVSPQKAATRVTPKKLPAKRLAHNVDTEETPKKSGKKDSTAVSAPPQKKMTKNTEPEPPNEMKRVRKVEVERSRSHVLCRNGTGKGSTFVLRYGCGMASKGGYETEGEAVVAAREWQHASE